jgi:Rieske Fe-S protein
MTTQASQKRSRLDPDPIPRRDWLGLSSLWTMAASFLFAAIGMMRLPKAAVLPSPSKKFRVTLPETLAPGEPFVPPGRSVALFRDAEGVYAISTVCTHLGCIVKPSAEGFECPCHGSRFAPDGEVRKGPAPRPLPWLKVSLSGSLVTIDEGTTVPQGTKVA